MWNLIPKIDLTAVYAFFANSLFILKGIYCDHNNLDIECSLNVIASIIKLNQQIINMRCIIS